MARRSEAKSFGQAEGCQVLQRYKVGGVTPPPASAGELPASNPFNPFGRRCAGLPGADLTQFSPMKKISSDAASVPRKSTWTWELTALSSRDRGSQNLYGQPNTPVLNAALASSNPATALNPFVDGPMASPDLLASIYSNASITTYKADSNIVDGFARGPLLELPAGPLTAVLGAEYVEKSIRSADEFTNPRTTSWERLFWQAPGRGREVFAVRAPCEQPIH
jgi:hypothetical protein